MSKVVLTEKFFDDLAPPTNLRRPPLYREKEFSGFRHKNQLLELTRKNKNDESVIPREYWDLPKRSLVNMKIEECNRIVNELECKFGRSLNQALHELAPVNYSFKNSRLSNYNLEKSVTNFPAIRPNLAILLSNSCTNAVKKRKKINQIVINHNINEESQLRLSKKIRLTMQHKTSDKRFEIDKGLPKFNEVNTTFFRKSKFCRLDCNLEAISTLAEQRGKSTNLLQKYQSLWLKRREMSLKRPIRLSDTTPSAKNKFVNLNDCDKENS
jgi:hypothetical protein